MNWMIQYGRKILKSLSQLFTAELLRAGDKPLSIGSIVMLILLALAVFFISRAIGEWMKRGLLVRLKLDRGSREAISTVISYFLSALGGLIVLQTAGINLSSLAVLAGVLGIGFGFGLQNLASNFISGLTLLVEQPIKVGDFVEVEGLLGTVENISIRSTIVRTIDGVFVIVPNIRFVENHIVNWTYRDPKCCIHVPVGVTYGSDPVLVTEALLAAARMESGVLSYPSPKVWFKCFGESSLNFELLVWIDQPANSEPIKSALNFRIEQELRHRHIPIPFPQRELWIRNIDELNTLIHKTSGTEVSNGNVASQKTSPSETTHPLSKSPNNLTLRELLRRVTYFESCSDLELRQLIEYGYRQLFPAGQIVCQENEPGDSFYIILTGSVEVFSQRAEKYIATLHDGEFFGEMSLLLGIPRSATVRTLSDTILFVVDRNDLQKLLVEHQGLADQIAQTLSERQQALRDLGLSTADASQETPFIWIRKRIQSLFGI
ncbi:cyclic nucleotide-binding domain-containing protein [Aerosakkonema funiforme]|uniref:cyclic nucleotide-binding domain-containing protein n=1 Tax=Aerosakkonema funiforme TaxID=1246630 RepID=UPI0035B70FFC